MITTLAHGGSRAYTPEEQRTLRDIFNSLCASLGKPKMKVYHANENRYYVSSLDSPEHDACSEMAIYLVELSIQEIGA